MADANKVYTLVLVAAIGVLVGISIVVNQSKDPVLKEILQQQQELVATQKKLVNQGPLDEAATVPGSPNLAVRVSSLEARVNSLETQLKNLGNLAKQAQRPAGPPPEDFTTVHDIDVAHSPVLGDEDAPVSIVEFVDFQCPFCARFHPPFVEAAKAYPGKVNLILKNFPLSFHPQARPAAKAAFAAHQQGKYFEYADRLLESGRELSEEKFFELAEELGLDLKKFKKDYRNEEKWEEFIKQDMILGQKVGVRGTPTFYINGRKTRARDVNSIKKEIEEVLEEKGEL